MISDAPGATTNSEAPAHIPVLLNEVLQFLEPFQGREGLRYFDGTFGRGGHYSAIREFIGKKIEAVVMDQDTEAIAHAQLKFSTHVESGELRPVHGNFSEFSQANMGEFDIMLLDLGVSSPQLDQPGRGFSFYHEGPLDMRMNLSQTLTAEYLVNTLSEDDLNNLFSKYGEVRRPFRVTRAIVHDRKEKAFQTTRQLAGLIERVDGWRVKGVHPATQYFMALRLAVNSELEVVEETLPKLMAALKDGGRLAVITFHSLEDRIVKNIFRSTDHGGFDVNRKVVIATEEEIESNPRSRSAKLRVFQKGDKPVVSKWGPKE